MTTYKDLESIQRSSQSIGQSLAGYGQLKRNLAAERYILDKEERTRLIEQQIPPILLEDIPIEDKLNKLFRIKGFLETQIGRQVTSGYIQSGMPMNAYQRETLQRQDRQRDLLTPEQQVQSAQIKAGIEPRVAPTKPASVSQQQWDLLTQEQQVQAAQIKAGIEPKALDPAEQAYRNLRNKKMQLDYDIANNPDIGTVAQKLKESQKIDKQLKQLDQKYNFEELMGPLKIEGQKQKNLPLPDDFKADLQEAIEEMQKGLSPERAFQGMAGKYPDYATELRRLLFLPKEDLMAELIRMFNTDEEPVTVTTEERTWKPNKELDETTARQILSEAGGDKEKARQIARQRGYKF